VLLLPLALAAGAMLSRRRARRTSVQLGRREAALLGRRSFRRTRAACAALSVLLLGVAWLRPVVLGEAERLGPDVVFCVDTSRSMAAADLVPSRFAAMLKELDTCLQQATAARAAVVAFAAEARLVVPLTGDLEAASWLAHELVPGTLGRGGSDLGRAIEAARALLQRSGSIGEIVLLTDGEDFGGGAAAAAAAALADGHRVHTVGFGSVGGSKIVVGEAGDGVFLRDGNGDEIVTRLDAIALAAVATAGGGAFVHASQSGALRALYRDELHRRTTALQLARGDAVLVPQYQWPLLAALLFWMLRWCLPERRR
jgi:Ca-activated chloride channel family protein